MAALGIIGLTIIIASGVITYYGLQSYSYLNRYSFRVDDILARKDYKRLITSGFLHVSWRHYIFNMLTLYFFSSGLEDFIGAGKFLAIYFGSLLGGNLLALFIHRNHYNYSAVGASGAVSGIVFAAIALFPGISIGFFFLPVHIPGWVYGLLYVLYSIYGIKSQKDNIGHEAHLGGGAIGLLIALAFFPEAITSNTLPILAILIPSILFVWLIAKKPNIITTGTSFGQKKKYYDIDEKYWAQKAEREKELNYLLDKISTKGMESLSDKEKERLKDLSEKTW
ncbi:rhomboid family intramembrane serine protease [Cytophagaceae bacterium ABcell3]|nr:rhomboid family intramembrane serine protease [Cytophagaceae bacterium ABcell3]